MHVGTHWKCQVVLWQLNSIDGCEEGLWSAIGWYMQQAARLLELEQNQNTARPFPTQRQLCAAACTVHCVLCTVHWAANRHADFGFSDTKSATHVGTNLTVHIRSNQHWRQTNYVSCYMTSNTRIKSAVPRLKQSVSGMSLPVVGFEPRTGPVGHTENNVALGYVFLQVLRLSVLRTIPSQLHIHTDAK